MCDPYAAVMGLVEPPFKCKKCKKTFNDFDAFSRHKCAELKK
jgi:transposase-like protein